MIKIKLGDKEFNVKEAHTQEEKQQGLMNVKELPSNEGMIFYYDEPDLVQMWMKNTLIPLDIIFINEDQEVISVKQGKPEDNTLIEKENVLYVVELNSNSGVNAIVIF